MKLNLVQTLHDIDGQPLLRQVQPAPGSGAQPAVVPMTLGDVLIACALAPPVQGQVYSERENVDRYLLAHEMKKLILETDPDDKTTFEIPGKFSRMLRADVSRMYPPGIAGPVLIILTPKEA